MPIDPDHLDPMQLGDLISQKKWVPLSVFVIWFVVRLLKSDTKFPIDLDWRLRALMAVALGGFAGALAKMTDGVTWTSALLQGLSGGVGAVMLQVLLNAARNGKEIPIPGLMKPGVPPTPGEPPTVPPAPPADPPSGTSPPAVLSRVIMGRPMLWRGVLVMCLALSGCALFSRENAPKTILTLEQIACIAENAFLNDTTLNQVCKLLTGVEQEQAKKVQLAARAGMYKEVVKSSNLVCTPAIEVDGGKDGGK